MSKPGEMVQILREDYEEQLEAYRILRNKFLIAVPGMDLDKEKQLYDQWKLDLHLNSIISFDRALPPEPRTCETCAPQSADVDTVREDFEKAMDELGFVKPKRSKIDGTYKNPRTQQWFSMFRNGYHAALDRIAGKEE